VTLAHDPRLCGECAEAEYVRPKPVVLRPITRSYGWTLNQRTGQPRRRECWEATTVDGEWSFERIEDTGTPWIVVHHPRSDHAETAVNYFGTLKAARTAVEKDWLRLPSQLSADHAAGKHTRREFGCPDCEGRK
jgi:hypothetical protein